MIMPDSVDRYEGYVYLKVANLYNFVNIYFTLVLESRQTAMKVEWSLKQRKRILSLFQTSLITSFK